MDSPQALENILKDPSFAPNIVVERLLQATEGSFAPFPQDVEPRIAEACKARGIDRIYTHQAEVWANVKKGRHTVVVTPTASGKTLCYNLPVLDALLRDDKARALYLFPTKALSQDQQSELNELVGAQGEDAIPVKVSTYDGDTPDSLRVAARDTGRIIISNPDMLHAGILPNHPKWIKFFSNLKYIVIDEAHAYRGVLGSHVADLIRRLKRIASFYGSRPVFILCSATIGNPKELAQTLIGEEVALVDKNGAPRGEKRIILYNPPLVDSVQGIRKSVVDESRRWMLAFLKAGIKTILFAHSRVKTEVAASYVNEDLANIFTDNSRIKVEAYRGGLLPNERREIERGLREGAIQGVVSTNALELGIDIGGLDASVVAGFPGSFSSFWQQSGRAGRRGGTSIAVFVASASPIDQFIMEDPEWFFRKNAEEARIDPDNPYILADHIKCAAFELPFRDDFLENGEDSFTSDEAVPVLEFLEEEGIVRHTSGKWHWADRSFPAEGISLRSATADNVVIIDVTKGRNTVIGEMDRPSAKELIFENAVYIHRGNQYLVEKLDIENRKCLVREAEVNYFTDGLVKTDIKVLTEDANFEYPENTARGVLGDVLVRSQVAKFKKIRFRTNENIGYGQIDLPEEEMQTRALMLLFDSESRGGKVLDGFDEAAAGAALSGTGTLIKNIAPVFLLCDPRDLGIAERVRDPHFGIPALYIYDKYPGGTGLAESLSHRTTELFKSAYRAAENCPCKSGCPSCVGPGGNKTASLEFLKTLSA
ncbi:DEAD/DEAH box helicase [Leadbettera azotonutricia]|uniref:Putative ATP-dependent helicase HRQ1 n=1 Tax=Leadbettera azotonutricia (strain ATCC BAA-888 / DSM 13862 / ZAS-9) TaxID=545695 RepID=F5YA73_LEAAZ|nr:DEAD/DEAH box helicase [Leadbettera azotonutricia]AEF80999.1 putative ATP-dependent helicase HRQ1 [Leadbettera azotonutricia ZAS-9]